MDFFWHATVVGKGFIGVGGMVMFGDWIITSVVTVMQHSRVDIELTCSVILLSTVF